jgi:DNA-binding NarL/FixJ family response regulator
VRTQHAHCARTLLVDDHVAVRRVVRVVLEGRFDIHALGEASNGTEAIEKAAALVPNLIIRLTAVETVLQSGYFCLWLHFFI